MKLLASSRHLQSHSIATAFSTSFTFLAFSKHSSCYNDQISLQLYVALGTFMNFAYQNNAVHKPRSPDNRENYIIIIILVWWFDIQNFDGVFWIVRIMEGTEQWV
jgi:hypothetical protein